MVSVIFILISSSAFYSCTFIFRVMVCFLISPYALRCCHTTNLQAVV